MGKKDLSKLKCLTLSPWASISVKYLVCGIQWQHFTSFYYKIISRTANAFFTTQNACFLPTHIQETIPENPTPFVRTYSKNSLSLDPFFGTKICISLFDQRSRTYRKLIARNWVRQFREWLDKYHIVRGRPSCPRGVLSGKEGWKLSSNTQA